LNEENYLKYHEQYEKREQEYRMNFNLKKKKTDKINTQNTTITQNTQNKTYIQNTITLTQQETHSSEPSYTNSGNQGTGTVSLKVESTFKSNDGPITPNLKIRIDYDEVMKII